LMATGSYDAVVELLSPLSQDTGSTSLQSLLEEAQTQREAFRQGIDMSLQTAEGFAREEQYDEAFRLLEAQPSAVLRSEPVQIALNRMREACSHEQSALQTVGKAYAALNSFQQGNAQASLHPDESGSKASLLTRIVPIFTSRRQFIADRRLSSAAEQVRLALDAGDGKQASELVKQAAIFREHASAGVQSEWNDLVKKAGKNKILRRLGVRGSSRQP
jgi:hypothetical protein